MMTNRRTLTEAKESCYLHLELLSSRVSGGGFALWSGVSNYAISSSSRT
jgi:hypothetical protein